MKSRNSSTFSKSVSARSSVTRRVVPPHSVAPENKFSPSRYTFCTSTTAVANCLNEARTKWFLTGGARISLSFLCARIVITYRNR